jgi:hypothetical protein
MSNGRIRPGASKCHGAWWGYGATDAQSGAWGQTTTAQTGTPASGAGRDLRVSDAERQETADQLKAHLAAGRLDINEYEERLQHALAARTRRDLDDLVSDLPSATIAPPVQRPHPSQVFFAPVLFAIAVLAVFTLAFGTRHWFFFPWWIVPIAFFVVSRHWRRGWRPTYSGPAR